MTQEQDTKICKICGMSIPTAAKKCPYCQHWHKWWVLSNPQVVAFFVIIPTFILLNVIMGSLFKPFRQWEQFSQHVDQVKIIEDKLEFGEGEYGPVVVIVGRVKNSSSVDWKDIRFQVEFLDSNGSLFDTGQQEIYTYRVPAEKDTPFKVSFRRHFPEKEYASYQVTIVSAADSRTWP